MVGDSAATGLVSRRRYGWCFASSRSRIRGKANIASRANLEKVALKNPRQLVNGQR